MKKLESVILHQNTIDISWSDTESGELTRKSYSENNSSELLTDVEGSEKYLEQLGWKIDNPPINIKPTKTGKKK